MFTIAYVVRMGTIGQAKTSIPVSALNVKAPIGINPRGRRVNMSFNYNKVFQELKSQLPNYQITYQECASDGNLLVMPGHGYYFLIVARCYVPEFEDDLVTHIRISKAQVRFDKEAFLTTIKHLLDESYNDAIPTKHGGKYDILVCR